MHKRKTFLFFFSFKFIITGFFLRDVPLRLVSLLGINCFVLLLYYYKSV